MWTLERIDSIGDEIVKHSTELPAGVVAGVLNLCGHVKTQQRELEATRAELESAERYISALKLAAYRVRDDVGDEDRVELARAEMAYESARAGHGEGE